MTTRTNPFNRGGVIKSELDSEEMREAKIAEMALRGYSVARTYERERTYKDYAPTGYNAAKFRYKGETASMRYGVVFRHQSSVEGVSAGK